MRFLIFLLLILSAKEMQAQLREYRLNLPKTSGFMSSYAEVNDDGTKLYRLVNVPRKNEAFLEVYNLKKGNILSRSRISGSPFLGSFIRLHDEEYFIFDVNDRRILKYQKGHITKVVNELDTNSKSGFGSFFVEMNFTPMVLHKGKLLMVNNLLLNPERGLGPSSSNVFIRRLDLSTGKLDYLTRVPKELERNDYGMLNRFACLQRGDKLLIAPYYSSEIYVYDLKSNTFKYPMHGKAQLQKVARPLLENKANVRGKISNKEYYSRMIKHYLTNEQFVGILYDKYKNYYYRIKLSFINGNKRKYRLSVVVLDANFNFKGVISIPDGYVYDNMFVTSEGLHITNHNKYLKDSDHLVFDTFNL